MSQILPERRTEAQGVQRWDPLSELDLVTERMRRMLEQTFGGVGGGLGLPSRQGERGGWSPLVDVEEQDDAYVIEAELPGIREEDVNIELVGNELTVTGEVKERENRGDVRRRMRRFGRFEYRVALPDQLDAENVEARLEDGVLTVRVPKSEKAHRRQIEVQRGSGREGSRGRKVGQGTRQGRRTTSEGTKQES